MKLTVVIVNYNVKYFVEQCLKSLRKALRNIESEVIVVDNHSKDGSVEYLKERRGIATFTGVASVDGHEVCSAELLCAKRRG